MTQISEKATGGRPTTRKITKPHLMRAVEIAGSIGKLANLIELDQSNISKWLYTDRKIPAHHVKLIIKVTNGKIKAWQLRPDVFEKN
jgi:DNA-binding transcriptional regulator YdaS (Cro superfamily)